MNKKTLALALSACVISLVLLTSCGADPAETGPVLQVTTSSWSGWSEDYEPEEETYTYAVDSPGAIMIPPEDGDGFKIELLEIGKDSLSFETESPMSVDDGGGINLMTDQTVFAVKKGQTLNLVTPTMDSGNIYIFEYK